MCCGGIVVGSNETDKKPDACRFWTTKYTVQGEESVPQLL